METDTKLTHRMVSYGTLAWCKLEFRFMGALFWRFNISRKIVFTQADEAMA
jgi:hypothetical protein